MNKYSNNLSYGKALEKLEVKFFLNYLAKQIFLEQQVLGTERLKFLSLRKSLTHEGNR